MNQGKDMQGKLFKVSTEKGYLGTELLKIKKMTMLNTLIGVGMLLAALCCTLLLMSGGQLELKDYKYLSQPGILLPDYASWLIVVVLLIIAFYFIYRAFFMPLEVIFHQFGVVAGNRIFFYCDLTDVEFFRVNILNYIRFSGKAGVYTQQVEQVKKGELYFIHQLSEFLKS